MSITVICLKVVEFWTKSKVKRSDFICNLITEIKADNIDIAIDYCNTVNSPVASVSKAGLIAFKNKEEQISEAMERETMIQTIELEKFTTVLGILGNITVYIGLFGTVLGIIKAFHNISRIGPSGIAVVIGGISEALIATAAGLFVAIPATIAYNFFAKTIDKFIVDMEYCGSVIEGTLKGKIIK
ncbi:MAG: MotA/TolQ/ExbB proton channel family protein [Endomicrobium sp.]|nr:MotA/TolQ/ExbB proton channel family protein [Endomicrobium sp.]